jgi:hypothetical protein
VSWSDVLSFSGLKSLSEIDIALRTQIGGLNAKFAKLELAEALRNSLLKEGVLMPDEGKFSDLSHNKLLSFVKSQGYEWVWVGDEFCTQRKLHWIEDLMSPDSNATDQCNVFTPDKKILWTTHWDSHFSFLCASQNVVDAMAVDPNFEGFACSWATEVYWSVS